MDILFNVVLLVLGMVFLIKGADFFVSGASKIAKSFKIPPLVIGLTLVSIGTSAPELSVSITSSIKGMNDMSLGNIVGSNIFNTFLVIGASAMFTPLIVSKDMKKYDIPTLIGIYTLLLLFCFVITPNKISFIEAMIIFILFFVYILFLILRSKNHKQEVVEEKIRKWYINLVIAVIGLVGIIFGGDLVVNQASKIAISLGMSELLVGLTIVAIGTSLPELVTSIVAAKRKENEIAIGNAIGSCIFNIILILGLSGMISPVTIEWSSLMDIIVMLFSAIMIFIIALKTDSQINKVMGFILIFCYILYLTYIILRNMGFLIY